MGRIRSGVEPRSPPIPALAELRDLVTGRESVSGEEYDAFLALADDPEFVWREAMMVSVLGRKPS